MKINFSAIILSAGFGKRMMPLTKELPKPLIEINGITLLENSINFLKELGCNQIIINTHYKHFKIQKLLNKIKENNNITLVYEKKILDTGGGVKNAISYFKNDNFLIVNSDIFWKKENQIDVKKLINSYVKLKKPHVLIVEKNKTYGIDKETGDFTLHGNKISRFKKGEKVFFYSGLQVMSIDIFDNFHKKKFSFNEVWDYLIDTNNLYGDTMNSNWFHVGDIEGLNIAKEFDS